MKQSISSAVRIACWNISCLMDAVAIPWKSSWYMEWRRDPTLKRCFQNFETLGCLGVPLTEYAAWRTQG